MIECTRCNWYLCRSCTPHWGSASMQLPLFRAGDAYTALASGPPQNVAPLAASSSGVEVPNKASNFALVGDAASTIGESASPTSRSLSVSLGHDELTRYEVTTVPEEAYSERGKGSSAGAPQRWNFLRHLTGNRAACKNSDLKLPLVRDCAKASGDSPESSKVASGPGWKQGHGLQDVFEFLAEAGQPACDDRYQQLASGPSCPAASA